MWVIQNLTENLLVKDEAVVAMHLPNLVDNVRVPEDEYTHLDFTWGIHNMEILYGPTIEEMKKYC